MSDVQYWKEELFEAMLQRARLKAFGCYLERKRTPDGGVYESWHCPDRSELEAIRAEFLNRADKAAIQIMLELSAPTRYSAEIISSVGGAAGIPPDPPVVGKV